jgi:hypothetical protein
MLNVGFTIKQITGEINRVLDTNIIYRELLYLIKKVQSKTIHREYDRIIMMDSVNDTANTGFSRFCVNFKGLFITYKSVSNLIGTKHIIAPDNLATISGKESLLYAKRILKLYHVPDADLLKKHKQNHPNQPDIDLTALMENIHISFTDEFNAMLSDLCKKYVHFITNNLKEKIDAKEANI